VNGEPLGTRETGWATTPGSGTGVDLSRRRESGPFPDWDKPDWDYPLDLLTAIRIWAPAFSRRLDQVKWVSPDEIKRIGHQRRRQDRYGHRLNPRWRRAEAKRQRDQDGGKGNGPPNQPAADLVDPDIPEVLRGEWTGLLSEWDHLSEADRLVHAFELAGHLIIEMTRRGEPYTLKYGRADFRCVSDPCYEAPGPYDFDFRNSSIRNPEGTWLTARIVGCTAAEAERIRAARLARKEQDRATAAAWSARLEKPSRERDLFSVFEIAEHLTRKSVAEPDVEKRDRVILDLDDRINREEFDLSGESEIVIKNLRAALFQILWSSRHRGCTRRLSGIQNRERSVTISAAIRGPAVH